jgi:hypothetical protein
MKKILLLLLLLILPFLSFLNAQNSEPRMLKKVLTFLMPRTVDDEMPGTRGASVVWHPLQKKYYAAMAGNIGYPLGVYDVKGKLLSDDSLNCNADVRGLWYNPIKKQVQGNSYNDYGWFAFILNAKGIPSGSKIFKEGMNQPDDQVVGAYRFPGDQVLFLYEGSISFYKSNAIATGKTLKINWGRSKADGIAEDEEEIEDESLTPGDYNYTTVVFTGLKGAELGFLNITEMQIELYNIADGFMTKKLKLPEDAPMNQSFNFAYTNGMFWLFNMETREWSAYK